MGLRSIFQAILLLLLAAFMKITFGRTPYSVTLTDKAASYLTYERWNSSNMVKISFSFKTYCSRCFLLYVDNTRGKHEKENYLLLTLLKGQLTVYVFRKSNQQNLKSTLTLAKDLYDIKWHKVDIILSKSGSYICVDKEKKILVDDAFLVSSPLHIGGIQDDANISSEAKSINMGYIQRFVGCIKSVMFTFKNGKRKRATEVSRNEVTPGCLNACRKDSCANDGRCLNWFVDTGCDCIGTGYQGPRCTRAATEAVFFNKTDFIKINLQEWQYPLELRMRFRTILPDGLLLATKLIEKGFYIALVDGYLKILIAPSKVLSFGNGMLHDSQWHYLTVKISKKSIDVTLDRRFCEALDIAQDPPILNFPFFIGSIPDASEESQSLMPLYFVGCLQQIYLQEIDVIDNVLHTEDSRLSISKDVMKSCPLRHENVEEAHNRIRSEKLLKLPTSSTVTEENVAVEEEKSNNNQPTKGARKDGKNSHAKLVAENNKDLIAWITSGVVSGTIVLMIMTACAIHYFKLKYENIFVSRMHERDAMQEQQSVNSVQMFPKQQTVVFLPEQGTKVVNL